jgi:hypothetical protein
VRALSLNARAQHDSDYETKGGGDAAGGNAAIGASFALAITEHSAAVRILRGLTSTGGAIAADAQGQFRSRSNAAAGSKGAADSGDADGVKQQGKAETGWGNAQAGSRGAGSSGTTQMPDASTSDGTMAGAAAIAFNIQTVDATVTAGLAAARFLLQHACRSRALDARHRQRRGHRRARPGCGRRGRLARSGGHDQRHRDLGPARRRPPGLGAERPGRRGAARRHARRDGGGAGPARPDARQRRGRQIDLDAAGHGWCVDATPLRNEAFRRADGALVARDGSAADGRMDLLTVVVHELGHLMGFVDDQEGIGPMAATLDAGRRISANHAHGLIEVPPAFALGAAKVFAEAVGDFVEAGWAAALREVAQGTALGGLALPRPEEGGAAGVIDWSQGWRSGR